MEIYCGLKRQPAGYQFQMAQYDHFQLIYVTAGLLFVTVQNRVTPLYPGQGCLLPCGAAFALHCTDGGYDGLGVIIFGGTEAILHGTVRTFTATPALQALTALLEAEIRTPGTRTEPLVQALGVALVEMGTRLASAPPAADDSNTYWVQVGCRCIERTIYSQQSLAASLGGIPLSYRQLSRHFHQVLGMTPKQYQLQCRFQEAERLLAATRTSITAVALELGFSSSQHFASQFSRYAGCSPSAYRLRHGLPAAE